MSGSRSKWCRQFVNSNIHMNDVAFADAVESLQFTDDIKIKLYRLRRYKKEDGVRRDPINEKLTRLWKKHRFGKKRRRSDENTTS